MIPLFRIPLLYTKLLYDNFSYCKYLFPLFRLSSSRSTSAVQLHFKPTYQINVYKNVCMYVKYWWLIKVVFSSSGVILHVVVMLSVVSGFRSYKKQNPFTESLKSAVSDACVHVARFSGEGLGSLPKKTCCKRRLKWDCDDSRLFITWTLSIWLNCHSLPSELFDL